MVVILFSAAIAGTSPFMLESAGSALISAAPASSNQTAAAGDVSQVAAAVERSTFHLSIFRDLGLLSISFLRQGSFQVLREAELHLAALLAGRPSPAG